MMTKLETMRIRAQRTPDELMPETDPKDRCAAFDRMDVAPSDSRSITAFDRCASHRAADFICGVDSREIGELPVDDYSHLVDHRCVGRRIFLDGIASAQLEEITNCHDVDLRRSSH